MATFQDFIYWGFLAMISGSVLYAANSLNALNIKIAVIIERIATHEHRIQKLEQKSE